MTGGRCERSGARPASRCGARLVGRELGRLHCPRRVRGERGSESVELAILLPVALLALAMIVVGARIWLAADRMSGVAGSAARDASLARSPDAARAVAEQGARDALGADGLHCRDVRVDVDTSGFTAAPGSGAAVRVDVWCTVALSDIGVKGLPGSRTLHDSAISPLDPARDTALGTNGFARPRVPAPTTGGLR